MNAVEVAEVPEGTEVEETPGRVPLPSIDEFGDTVGGRCKARRLQLGLSQQKIAGKGLTTAHISRVEAGLRNASVKALRQLAEKLDVESRWLETGRATVRFCATARVVSDRKIELKVVGPEVDMLDEFMLDELLAAGFDVQKFIRGPLIVTISKV